MNLIDSNLMDDREGGRRKEEEVALFRNSKISSGSKFLLRKSACKMVFHDVI